MPLTHRHALRTTLLASAIALASQATQAAESPGFIDGSSATLNLRNFYMNVRSGYRPWRGSWMRVRRF